ncbi:MAG: hypothetical protein OEX19_05785 [Gammaproteobacteria bacterium]|nr:hypothetical protein [Gammaproteobacteria bacterium]
MLRMFLVFVLLGLLLSSGVVAADKKKDKNRYEDDDIGFRVVPRSPDNIIAFYQGRGFLQTAIDEIKKTCYVTFLMRNLSDSIIWLDLDNWRYISDDPNFKRLKRPYWKEKWQVLNLPMSFQSTFGWSLLPDVRDLHPDEGVGGSTTFTFTDKPFVVEARFKLGRNKDEGEKVIRFEQVRCVEQ